MPTATLALRAWLRYLVPLSLLAAIVMAAFGWIALHAHVAPDLRQARVQLGTGWALAATAWSLQLVLVAAVAPAVRGLAHGTPLSQGGALAAGLRGLGRGLVPCALATLAIVFGGLGLVVPGLLLLVLFAMTGASDELGEPLPAPLLDAARVARANLRPAIAVVAIALGLDLAIALAANLALVHALPRKPAPGALAVTRTFLRWVVLGLALVSTGTACGIAAAYQRRRPGRA